MKQLNMCAVLSVLTISSVFGQTWDEWFRQKKTQKKYLIQQVAALKVYLEYLKEGYRIVEKGMTVVGDIKEGNFKDHKSYFESLRNVKSVISASPKASKIYYQQALILQELSSVIKKSGKSNHLTEGEKAYIKRVGDNMITQCENSIYELENIVSNGMLQMSDDERIERLYLLYNDLTDKYSFTKTFVSAVNLLLLQRRQDENEIGVLSDLDDLK